MFCGIVTELRLAVKNGVTPKINPDTIRISQLRQCFVKYKIPSMICLLI